MGFAIAYLLMQWLFKQHKIANEKFEPMFMYVFLGAFIGARLGHCFFYEPKEFFDSWQHFVEIFLPIKFLASGGWKFVGYQGLASHGGVVGLLIALYLYIKRTKLNPWLVLDFMGICSTITSVFIRLGNLMNSEIIGRVTDVPWAFIFYDVDTYPRHPGQLYEQLLTLFSSGLYFSFTGNILKRLVLVFTLGFALRLYSLSVSSLNLQKKYRFHSNRAYLLIWDKYLVCRS